MENISDGVMAIVTAQARQAKPGCTDDIQPCIKFADLGLDGLDMIEIVARCEEAFGVALPDEELRFRESVSYLVEMISDRLRERSEREARAASETLWDDFPGDAP